MRNTNGNALEWKREFRHAKLVSVAKNDAVRIRTLLAIEHY
jgi:hypothetical protein